jgi:nucleotide-binding universal stress UspA family protein
MVKTLLVAVDNSKNSLKAIRYVSETIKPDSRITLLSIIPDPSAACGLDGQSLMPLFKANVQTFCTIEDAKKAAMEGFMEEAKKILINAGFASENVVIKIRKRKAGIARDILKESEKGKYDTLVIGRRGLSGIKQFISGSISHKIMEHSKDITVTVVE